MERSVGGDGDVGGAGGSHGVDVRKAPIAESAALLEYNHPALLAGARDRAARDRAARAVLRIPTAGAADFFLT